MPLQSRVARLAVLGRTVAAAGLTVLVLAAGSLFAPAGTVPGRPMAGFASGGLVPAAAGSPSGGLLPAAARQPAAAETAFVPLTPCRVVDTRTGGGALSAGAPRDVLVAGTSGFPAQGGHPGGCGVPVGATAVAVNVTTTQTTGSGFLTGYAAGGTEPTSSFLSFALGVNTTASPILPLAAGAAAQLTIAAHSHDTQLIIDVTGYYAYQVAALISTTGGSGAVYAGSPRVLSVANAGAGVALVTLDRDVSYCAVSATAYGPAGGYASAMGFNGAKVTVWTWSLDDTTHLLVPANTYAYLTISC